MKTKVTIILSICVVIGGMFFFKWRVRSARELDAKTQLEVLYRLERSQLEKGLPLLTTPESLGLNPVSSFVFLSACQNQEDLVLVGAPKTPKPWYQMLTAPWAKRVALSAVSKACSTGAQAFVGLAVGEVSFNTSMVWSIDSNGRFELRGSM